MYLFFSSRKLLRNDEHFNEPEERSSNVSVVRASGAFFYYYRENDEPVCTYVSRTVSTIHAILMFDCGDSINQSFL